MGIVTTTDGTEIHYKDWGDGPPVVLSHGWPLNADSWEAQMLFLAGRGQRCIAHDRRGHGRSTQTWDGNEMDTYADDLAALIEARVEPRIEREFVTAPQAFRRSVRWLPIGVRVDLDRPAPATTRGPPAGAHERRRDTTRQ